MKNSPAESCSCPNSTALPGKNYFKIFIILLKSQTVGAVQYRDQERQSQDVMHATAGRQDPSQADNIKSESPACYLPQPEDALMAQKVKNRTHPRVSS